MRSKEAKADPANPTSAAPGAVAMDAPVPAAGSSPPAGELEQLQAQAADHWDKLLRTTADFDNFKKRAARERQDAIVYANTALLQKLIPVLDNFDMALSATTVSSEGAAKSLQAGVQMIGQQLRSALTEAGLEEIDASGRPFDPNFHEAVSQLETTDTPEGHVVQQLRKGYKLRDRLLRPATVIVAKKPAPASGDTQPT